jgi:ketosteroid isomerase-like protein
MPTTTKTDTIKEMYAAFGRGDLQGLLSHVSADCTWDNAGPKELPWAGTFRGPDGISRFFAEIEKTADIQAFEPRTFVEQGDHVVVLGYEKGRSKRTGRTYETNWAHAFTLADGKVVAFRQYHDTAAVVKALGG